MERDAAEPSSPERLLAAWTAAFNASDVAAIAALYDPQALFWGTIATTVAPQPDAVHAYFRTIFGMQPAPQVDVTSCLTRHHGGFVVLAGTYALKLVSGQQAIEWPARFTFTLAPTAAGWRIVEHHSSLLPSGQLVPSPSA